MFKHDINAHTHTHFRTTYSYNLGGNMRSPRDNVQYLTRFSRRWEGCFFAHLLHIARSSFMQLQHPISSTQSTC